MDNLTINKLRDLLWAAKEAILVSLVAYPKAGAIAAALNAIDAALSLAPSYSLPSVAAVQESPMRVDDQIVTFLRDEIREQPLPRPPRVSESGVLTALVDEREDVRIIAELVARRRGLVPARAPGRRGSAR